MAAHTRRNFLTYSSLATATIAVTTASSVSASAAPSGPAGTEPVMAYIKNPKTGEISLMSGEREVTVHDKELAARLTRMACHLDRD